MTIYVEGDEAIKRAEKSIASYKNFILGLWRPGGAAARKLWYDDVAVAAERIGCVD